MGAAPGFNVGFAGRPVTLIDTAYWSGTDSSSGTAGIGGAETVDTGHAGSPAGAGFGAEDGVLAVEAVAEVDTGTDAEAGAEAEDDAEAEVGAADVASPFPQPASAKTPMAASGIRRGRTRRLMAFIVVPQ
ncbi:hypothetical protein [Solihabitans fulvus]|uniref:hypothetical protein n=1 Tax=Solihabitans fulvus TaxID=1892852 RepID=UPI00122E025F|nr:hypothetical protein [Solihabitans fulvus]